MGSGFWLLFPLLSDNFSAYFPDPAVQRNDSAQPVRQVYGQLKFFYLQKQSSLSYAYYIIKTQKQATAISINIRYNGCSKILRYSTFYLLLKFIIRSTCYETTLRAIFNYLYKFSFL